CGRALQQLSDRSDLAQMSGLTVASEGKPHRALRRDGSLRLKSRQREGTPLARWKFEPGHTAAEFCVRHMMVTYVRGHFKNIQGRLEFDPERPEDGSLEIRIDATKLWTDEPERDAHLRSADFLDVEHHPTITFKSTKVEPTARTEYTVTGDLTIRGATRPLTLDVR